MLLIVFKQVEKRLFIFKQKRCEFKQAATPGLELMTCILRNKGDGIDAGIF